MQLDEYNLLLPQEQKQDRDLLGLGIMETEPEVLLLPEMAFLPDGYIEPKTEMRLSFSSSEVEFNYQW